MKALLSLLTIIVLSVVALKTTPHIQLARSNESSRIESVEPAKTVNVPVKETKAVVAPAEQPKPVPETKVSDTPPPISTGNCTIAYNYDWPKQTAYAVCMAESSGNYREFNGSDNHGQCVGSYGLFQIGCFWFSYYGHPITYDANINVDIAYNIWKRQGGFGAWTAYTSGKYLRYL